MKKDREELRAQLLILRCQTGDENAFSELFRAFSGRTHRYLRGLLGTEAADDVQQDVWMTVYRTLATLHNPGGFRTWLYRITRHRAIDRLRREQQTAERFEVLSDDDLAGTPDSPASEPELGKAEIEAALDGLTPAHREVLLLKYWEEMSYAEIALVAGCSIGTVRSRVHHAKQSIKTILEEKPTQAQ